MVPLQAADELGKPVVDADGMDRAIPESTCRHFMYSGSLGRQLVSRGEPGNVITDVDRVVKRAVRMVQDGEVEAVDGTKLELRVHYLRARQHSRGRVSG